MHPFGHDGSSETKSRKASRGLFEGHLEHGWMASDISSTIDLNVPGIYEWRLAGIGIYVGKSRRLRSRIREYPNNVRKLIAGLDYRRGKATAYRNVHHHLRAAYEIAASVTVTVLENCELADLNDRERYWIERRRAEALRGGLQVLNSC